jgi:hypothetical protein
MTDVYEGEIGDDGFDFADDFGFRAGLEGLEGEVEYRFLFRFFLVYR